MDRPAHPEPASIVRALAWHAAELLVRSGAKRPAAVELDHEGAVVVVQFWPAPRPGSPRPKSRKLSPAVARLCAPVVAAVTAAAGSLDAKAIRKALRESKIEASASTLGKTLAYLVATKRLAHDRRCGYNLPDRGDGLFAGHSDDRT